MATKEDDVFIYKMGVKVFKNVTRVRGHPSARHIPPHAFDRCRDLVEVELNENVYTIGTCAFKNCTSLRSIPSNVTSIKDDAFQGCTSLSVVELKEHLQLGQREFMNCTSLLSMKILPKKVIAIQDDLFCGCTSLLQVKMSEVLSELGQFHQQ